MNFKLINNLSLSSRVHYLVTNDKIRLTQFTITQFMSLDSLPSENIQSIPHIAST